MSRAEDAKHRGCHWCTEENPIRCLAMGLRATNRHYMALELVGLRRHARRLGFKLVAKVIQDDR